MKYFLLFTVLMAASCTKKSTPEGFLKEYIYSRYGKKVKKDYILSKATGNFYEEVSSIDGEKLESLLDLSKFSLKKFKVLSKDCGNNTCTISYSIKYKQAKDTVSSKKIVELSKVEDAWRISQVNNVKTFIESEQIVK